MDQCAAQHRKRSLWRQHNRNTACDIELAASLAAVALPKLFVHQTDRRLPAAAGEGRRAEEHRHHVSIAAPPRDAEARARAQARVASRRRSNRAAASGLPCIRLTAIRERGADHPLPSAPRERDCDATPAIADGHGSLGVEPAPQAGGL